MNNFQNYTTRKLIFSANNAADRREIKESDQQPGKEEGKNREKFEGNKLPKWCRDSDGNNKNAKDFYGSVDDQKNTRKASKKVEQKQEDVSAQKINYFAPAESQLSKQKPVGKVKPQKSRTQYVEELLKNVQSFSQEARPQLEGLKAPLNNLFTKSQRPEIIKPKGSNLSAEQILSHRKFERMNKAETAGVAFEAGQKHINEILKSHAQKVHSMSIKTSSVKVFALQGVPDLLKKGQNASETGVAQEVTENKRSTVKTEIKQEELKSKAWEKNSGEGQHNEDNSEDKKKISSNWIKIPQSNELERRLKGTWEHQGSLFPQDKSQKSQTPAEKPEEEKKLPSKPQTAPQEDRKTKKLETLFQDEEKKTEKRTTYTDRLLLLKMIGKELDGKKQTAGVATAAKNNSQEKDSNPKTPSSIKDRQENVKKSEELPLIKALDMNIPPDAPVKEITICNNKELVAMKPPMQDVEPIIRTKQTRSAELRDIVNQAIKEHKIFCIFDNHSYIVKPVREELLARGWLEVVPDRRLIPRRRPPPMGPTLERDKSNTERNCNTLEAILSAKETFADELQETVSKTPSFRWTVEKPKPVTRPAPVANKKPSEESLNETPSEFRIIPPTTERKKNNIEIREFTAKYQAILAKENDRERAIRRLREREKNAKAQKKEKSKALSANADKLKTNGREKEKEKEKESNHEHVILPGSKSFQDILHSIRENKKTIVHAASEIRHMEGKGLDSKPELGVLFDAANTGAKDLLALKPKTQDKMVGTVQEKSVCVNGKAIFTESEVKTMSKIIQSNNARIHFMWLSIKPGIHLKCFNYSPEIINKFQRTTFCTKIGLWSHLNNIQWYAHEVHYPAKSPRMYNTGEADDLQAFFEDFQMTACIGLLKWLSDTFFERGLKAVQAKKGKVPLKAFEFAIKQCEKYIRFKENEDLSILDESKVPSDEWNTFLQWFYIITNDHGKVQESSSAQLMVVYTKAVETLKLIRRHWPEMDIDGRLNIWIMKPYCASCGRGIFMTNNVYYIGQHTKYIVQKYIEKPLLIYNTKFDIRQWFMITKLTPLEIWMYKECYLRFCTQPFALRNLHESVHLSNNSVQRKYISYRDPSLPDQNMWDSNTFQLYLKTIGQPTTWEEIIYPGMKDAIVSTMLASQDTFDGPRKSWFEVYGADFMLSANLKEGPWLIEINENPAMDPSTKVTARLCPQMLRDVIKVVVDKRANKNASTGQWELIYRQNYSPSFGTVDLDIKGKKIARVPHAKNISSLSYHPSSSPVYTKRYSQNDVEPERLYDYVKSFEKQQNRGDVIDFGRTRGEMNKRIRKSLSKEPPKCGSLDMESGKRDSTFDHLFPVGQSGKKNALWVQSNSRNEKYKFTKFYNV